jgi:hypothetical protein
MPRLGRKQPRTDDEEVQLVAALLAVGLWLAKLLERPLGVRGVTNPLAAAGGADPEARGRARSDAPRSVRAVEVAGVAVLIALLTHRKRQLQHCNKNAEAGAPS